MKLGNEWNGFPVEPQNDFNSDTARRIANLDAVIHTSATTIADDDERLDNAGEGTLDESVPDLRT